MAGEMARVEKAFQYSARQGGAPRWDVSMKVLVVNSGSSSLKYQLINTGTEQVLARGLCERIGDPAGGGRLKHNSEGRHQLIREEPVQDHIKAVDLAFAALVDPEYGAISDLDEIDAVGHRVVNGGEKLIRPVRINDEVIRVVDEMSPLSPLHNPPNLMGIQACMDRLPEKPQVAVFDTAFHSTMPPKAYMYALPYELYEEMGIRRYGFHGTSHKYVSRRAVDMLRECGLTDTKIVTCHLGNGCSMAAVVNGECVDTTMGVSPAEGLVMGTRSGDIDPAILPFLAKHKGWSPDELENLINKRSGLLGVSGTSNDMRDVEDGAAGGDERAELALELFCYRIRKYIGAYAAAMNGLDAIVFTGGIGENSPVVRGRVCSGLGVLGVHLDEAANEARGTERAISRSDSRVQVLVIPTNEELEIARETVEIASAVQTG